MKVRELVRLIEKDGWYHARFRGSHHQFKHPNKPGLVTVPGRAGDELGHAEQYTEASRTEMSRYLIIIEPTSTGFSAYSPDLPGCVSTGTDREEVRKNMREAIEFHLDGLREAGQPLPPPSVEAAFCEV